MSTYIYSKKTIRDYLQSLYAYGLQRSKHLHDADIEELLGNIGIFKFKGYVYAFRGHIHDYNIDDVLMVYFFDKYLSKLLMDITSGIETKLKTILVELCYSQLHGLPRTDPMKDNPFFYLMSGNYKIKYDRHGMVIPPELRGVSVQNWKNHTTTTRDSSYLHFGLYYKNNYDFGLNRRHYLMGQPLLNTYSDINYPPFHYFVESSVLGTVIYLIENLQIGSYDLLQKVASKFGITNTRRIDFIPYLKRLNEVRNRAAHRERLFNRSYVSVPRIGHFATLSSPRGDHRLLDVFVYLFFMLGELNKYPDRSSFLQEEIERIFRDFRKDYYIRIASKRLTKKMKRKDFEKVKKFIFRSM